MKKSDALSKFRNCPHQPRRGRERSRSRGAAFVFAAVLAALACVSCDEPRLSGQGTGADEPLPELSDRSGQALLNDASPLSSDSASSAISVTYPLDFTIENPDGRRLTGVVLGKEGDEIAFRRDSDNGEFLIPLSGLGTSSWVALSDLPDGGTEQLETLRYREVEVDVEVAAVPERRPTLGNDFMETVEEALERAKAGDQGQRHVLVSFLGRNEGASGECLSNSGST